MSTRTETRRVARLLKHLELKVVFAESCTGGLVSGALTAVPGISRYHCGGMVVYRETTKTAYLGISPAVLARHTAVSPKVAELMARGVLQATPEAEWASAVTGHLGPNAPERQDGLVFVAVARRGRRPVITKLQCDRDDSRVVRQRFVVLQVLRLLAEALEQATQR